MPVLSRPLIQQFVAPPLRPAIFAQPQEDPTQIAAQKLRVFFTPPVQNPTNRPFLSNVPQDESQVPSISTNGALIPSQAPVNDVTPYAFWVNGYWALARAREATRLHTEHLRQLTVESRQVQNAIDQARNEKAKAKEERRLARNKKERERLAALIDELAVQIAGDMRHEAALLAEIDDLEALLLLLY